MASKEKQEEHPQDRQGGEAGEAGDHSEVSSIALEEGSGGMTNMPLMPVGEKPHSVSSDMSMNMSMSEDALDSVSPHQPAPKTAKQKAALEERLTLGKRESRAILCLRIVVILFLLVLGVSTSSAIYIWFSSAEQETFETQFGFYADRVIESFNLGIQRKMSAVDALSMSVTSFALENELEFPYVTIPNFEYKGSSARITGDTVMMLYTPIIRDEATRLQWEAYTVANNQHLGRAYRKEQWEKRTQDIKFGLANPEKDGEGFDALDSGELDVSEENVPEQIWFPGGSEAEDAKLQPPYFPVWHLSPLLPPEAEIINLDMSKYSYNQLALPVLMETGQACIDIMTDLSGEGDVDGDADIDADVDVEADQSSSAFFDLVLQHGQYRHNSEHYLGDPLSTLSYPVFDKFGNGRKVVGSLITTLYWRFLFSNILPQSIYGVICVLENSLGQKATYRIDGYDAMYLGGEDIHDEEYHYMEKKVDIADYINLTSSPKTQTFTWADLNSDSLNYTLRVYPSDEFRDIYVTKSATEQAVGSATIFAVAIFVFLIYDCCVQRRQRIVMDRAVKSHALVSSLFPENVRERILNDDHDDDKKVTRKQAFLNRRNSNGSSISRGGGRGTRPIADKFPNCTVFFADLAGFTKWSSTREPEQVFVLLEAMFKEFDAIALRRGVFKVETIGDCYMAVTGLPAPQADHAIRMAKFANDCLAKLDQVTSDLSNTLGEGTDELTLRIGMHSGEVTAGVLRGDKGRFQLFGDTVNTASRMESNGVPRQIQVSQSTADSLIVHGKGTWLTPREEKVMAKGKGEMQTYWLQVKDRSNKSQSIGRSSITLVSSDVGTVTKFGVAQ